MKAKPLIYLWLWMLTSLIAGQTFAQGIDSSRIKVAEDIPFEKERKTPKPKMFFNRDLRIGVDISTLISGAISPVRTGIDLSLEYTIKPKIFLILEGGYNYFEKKNDRIQYISKGNYLRVGADFNMRNPVDENDRDIFYLGFRYGYSRFEQEAPWFLLLNGYWANTYSSFEPEKGYAHWLEFITGYKVEVLKNWYLGMGLRLKFFLARSKTNIEPVQYVPGYAKNYNSGVLDFNYTISYNIPLNYEKKKLAVYERNK